MEDLETIELIIDEETDFSGIQAISVVERPAIEEDFIFLKSDKDKINLAEVDSERRILMGAALIPDKKIYRRDVNGKEYNIFFTKDTVVRASQLFLMKGKQNNSTLEHEIDIDGLSVVESWIIEDEVHDKSRKFGLDMPLGTWMVSVKVQNDVIWDEFVKTKKVKGFSIEGFFVDKLANSEKEEVAASEALEIIKKLIG
jgi:hypothetical protein